MRVLVVEDYAPLRDAVAQALREEGYAVDATGDGAEGLWHARGAEYDAIVLDLMLPGMDGLEVLRHLRAEGSRQPVLVLTARDAVRDRVTGLDAGADDYLTKPFALEELLARVRALVRRNYGDASTMIEIGALTIDTASKAVAIDGETIPLTAREFTVLEILARRRGRVVSREDFREHLYDDVAAATSNIVDVYIGYLRKKLHRPDGPAFIRTLRGQGYVLDA